MTDINYVSLSISSVLLLKPPRFEDHRGWFMETWSKSTFCKIGISASFVQDNHSMSMKRGTIRGLHFQAPPHAQAKLVRVLRGSIFDVAVDLRAGSPSYGKWCGATLTAAGGEQLFLPRGFAHGFCTLEDDVEVAYKVDDVYAPACDAGLIWSDADLGIDWPISISEAVLSEKDAALPPFSSFSSPFVFTERGTGSPV